MPSAVVAEEARHFGAAADTVAPPAASESGVFEDPDFWVYFQPITLYNALAQRRRTFLRRTLAYASKAGARGQPSEPAGSRQPAQRLQVCVQDAIGTLQAPGSGTNDSRVSLIVALCERLTNQEEYRPVAATLLHLSPTWQPGASGGKAPGSTKGAAAATKPSVAAAGTAARPGATTAALRLPDGPLHNLHLLVAVPDASPDLASLLSKAPGGKLSTHLDPSVCLGLLRIGSVVWAGSAPLAQALQGAGAGQEAAEVQVPLQLSRRSLSMRAHRLLPPPAAPPQPSDTAAAAGPGARQAVQSVTGVPARKLGPGALRTLCLSPVAGGDAGDELQAGAGGKAGGLCSGQAAGHALGNGKAAAAQTAPGSAEASVVAPKGKQPDKGQDKAVVKESEKPKDRGRGSAAVAVPEWGVTAARIGSLALTLTLSVDRQASSAGAQHRDGAAATAAAATAAGSGLQPGQARAQQGQAQGQQGKSMAQQAANCEGDGAASSLKRAADAAPADGAPTKRRRTATAGGKAAAAAAAAGTAGAAAGASVPQTSAQQQQQPAHASQHETLQQQRQQQQRLQVGGVGGGTELGAVPAAPGDAANAAAASVPAALVSEPPQGWVLYGFLYAGDRKVARQWERGLRCALCGVACACVTGLEQHLAASHHHLCFEVHSRSGSANGGGRADTAAPAWDAGRWLRQLGEQGPVPKGMEAVVLVRVPLDIFDPDTGRLLSRPERAYCFDPETNKEDIVMNCFTYHRRSGMKAPTDADPDAARALGELVASPLPIPLPRSLPPLPLRTDASGSLLPAGGRRRRAASASAAAGHEAGLAAGRTRQYFHSRTAVRIPEQETAHGDDTDDELDREENERFFKLCMRKARHLTATERQLMLMWNCFTTAHPVYADYTVPARTLAFVQAHAAEVRESPALRRSLVTFLLALWDYSLIGADALDACMRACAPGGAPVQVQEEAAAAGGAVAAVAAAVGAGAAVVAGPAVAGEAAVGAKGAAAGAKMGSGKGEAAAGAKTGLEQAGAKRAAGSSAATGDLLRSNGVVAAGQSEKGKQELEKGKVGQAAQSKAGGKEAEKGDRSGAEGAGDGSGLAAKAKMLVGKADQPLKQVQGLASTKSKEEQQPQQPQPSKAKATATVPAAQQQQQAAAMGGAAASKASQPSKANAVAVVSPAQQQQAAAAGAAASKASQPSKAKAVAATPPAQQQQQAAAAGAAAAGKASQPSKTKGNAMGALPAVQQEGAAAAGKVSQPGKTNGNSTGALPAVQQEGAGAGKATAKQLQPAKVQRPRLQQ